MDRPRFLQVAESIGVSLTDAQLDAFTRFEENLYAANEVMNLTRVPRDDCWLRHFVDSLLVANLLPQGASVLDIGSGPGFPAWPLACARPDLWVTALDSSGKMLGFLRQNLLPNLKVVQARAEESGLREAFDVVTGRAVAPLPAQLEISAAPCKVGGQIVPMRTPNDVLDLPCLRFLGLRMDRIERREPLDTDVVRIFPVYVKLRTTPTRYPRRWAEIKANPL